MKPIQVEVFSSPGCTRCSKTLNLVETIAQELGVENIEWRKIDVVAELDYAVELGVLSLPAIAIDGELVSKRHPSANSLREELQARLQEES